MVIHNASIMNAAGCCGLQLYNFGQTISMVFFTDTWKPDSWYEKILINKKAGLHTLCLLGTVLPPSNHSTPTLDIYFTDFFFSLSLFLVLSFAFFSFSLSLFLFLSFSFSLSLFRFFSFSRFFLFLPLFLFLLVRLKFNYIPCFQILR